MVIFDLLMMMQHRAHAGVAAPDGAEAARRCLVGCVVGDAVDVLRSKLIDGPRPSSGSDQ
jgi:hypothetical protein